MEALPGDMELKMNVFVALDRISLGIQFYPPTAQAYLLQSFLERRAARKSSSEHTYLPRGHAAR